MTLVVEIVRPYIFFSAFWVTAGLSLWWIAVPLGVASVLSGFVQMHDTLHNALGLPKRFNAFLLTLSGLLILKSGHGNQVTHLRHHGKCLDAEHDPEGAPALWSLREVFLRGPYHLLLLRREALRMAPHTRTRQLWETAANMALLGVFVTLYLVWQRPEGLVYWAIAFVMSATMPLWATYIPHHLASSNPLRLAVLSRVRIWTPVLSSFAFHHLHHQYPKVPTALLPKAARELPEMEDHHHHH